MKIAEKDIIGAHRGIRCVAELSADPDRTCTVLLAPGATFTDLLAGVLEGFGFYDHDHWAQFELFNNGLLPRCRFERRDVNAIYFTPVSCQSMDDPYVVLEYLDRDGVDDARGIAVGLIVRPGEAFRLRFDFGDNWRWRITVEPEEVAAVKRHVVTAPCASAPAQYPLELESTGA